MQASESAECVRHTYQEGLRDGEIKTIKECLSTHSTRLDRLDGKVSTLERVSYTVLGAIALVQFAPALKGFLG